MMRLYFARHGESIANLLEEFSNRGIKHGLTEKGQQQAATLAQRLKDASIARIYSSPLLRATQTAAILAAELCVPWEAPTPCANLTLASLKAGRTPESWRVFRELLTAWLDRQEWDRRIEQRGEFLGYPGTLCAVYRRHTETKMACGLRCSAGRAWRDVCMHAAVAY